MAQRGQQQQRGRGSRDRRGAAPSPQPAASSTPSSLLREAETLQQRAERRSGQDALAGFEAAAAKYREALQAGLPAPDAAADASFGLAECLQAWADLRRDLLRQAPDAELAQPGHEQAVLQEVSRAYAASLQAYQQVPAAPGAAALRADAAVNAANTLCSLADLHPAGPEALQQLQQAVQLYQAALEEEQEDADVLSNLGDAQVALGEAALLAGQPEAGEAAFAAGLQAYQASCTLSDSANGDDLPGLLHNWGVGLHTVSKHAQQPQLKLSLLEQAASRLRSSTQFSRGDPAPHNALGDVLMDTAEQLMADGSGAGADLQGPSGGSQQAAAAAAEAPGPAGHPAGSLPAATAGAAAAAIKAAVDEGYMAALTINRTNADALVGLAEASVAMAKLAWRQGDAPAAATHVNAAVGHMSSALQRPHLLGDMGERADVRYNAACAAALAGHQQACQEWLQAAAAGGKLDAREVAADSDLAAVRGQPWFAQLLQQLRQ